MTDAPVYTEEALRSRFHDLTAQRDAIHAVSMPLREARDAELNPILEAVRAKRAQHDEGIREAEAGLFEIEQERAILVRALKGQTGQPEEPPLTEG